jgi:hypothetical protein
MPDNCNFISHDVEVFKHLDEVFFAKRMNILHESKKFKKTYLFNNSKAGVDNHYLSIYIDHEKSFLSIKGSIRKWYYGLTSLNDLTKNDFYQAVKRISECLEIPLYKVFQFEIYSIEIGLNIRINVDLDLVLKQAYKFRGLKRQEKPFDNYISFTNSDQMLTMYGKKKQILAEIEEPNKKKWTTKYQRENVKYKFRDNNIIRIEYKVFGGKFNINQKLKIENLGQLITNYKRIYLLYWDIVQDIEFKNDDDSLIEFRPKQGYGKELNDYIGLCFLQIFGVDGMNSLINKLKSSSRRQMRMILKKRIKKLNEINQQTILHSALLNSIKRELVILFWKNKFRSEIKHFLATNNTIK